VVVRVVVIMVFFLVVVVVVRVDIELHQVSRWLAALH